MASPASSKTRPMPDRVREAIFDMLGAYYDTPGGLPGVHVADVFAGSGSMGLEALSRGAASCCFFERSRTALAALKQNLDALRVGPEASLAAGDAWREALGGPGERQFDLVLLDPPYADSADTSSAGAVRQYLAQLGEVSSSTPLVVLHHDQRVRYEAKAGDNWTVYKQRKFGSNLVTFFEL